MINTVKFAISVLAVATGCLAQEGLTIDNKHKERVSIPEAEQIYFSAEKSSISGVRSLREPNLFWAPTRTRYGLRGEKSGLPNGIVTPSQRGSCSWLLRISCHRSR